MSVKDDPAFQARLRALSDTFSKTIPGTLAQLRSGVAALDPAAPSEVAIKDLRTTLHSVAGSAATFGFPHFGQQARVVEHAQLALCARSDASAADWQTWKDSVSALIAWAEQDPSQPYPGA